MEKLMAKSAPGKHYRTGLSLMQIMDLFQNDREAEQWFEQSRWHDGISCPKCGSHDIYTRPEEKRRNQPHRCRSCKSDFSVKTDTLMHKSNIGYRAWAVGLYLMTTNLKGVSSMKIHRDLGITQKSAWMMMHKIRETFDDESGISFNGPVEVDETFMGGKRKNMSNAKRKELKDTGRGAVGKTAVVGMKDRETNEVTASVVADTNADTLQDFVTENTDKDAMVYTDGATAYDGIKRPHKTVNHSVSKYVNGMAHTNGIESFWAMLKRGYHGTFHKMSVKHLHRYVNEFSGRHNIRPNDTIDQMKWIAHKMDGKQLPYKKLVSCK